MPLKSQKEATIALERWLVDEAFEIKQSEGPVEAHRVRINPEVNVPQTQGHMARTPIEVESPSQSDKKGNGIEFTSSSPHMTPTHTKIESNGGLHAQHEEVESQPLINLDGEFQEWKWSMIRD